MSPQRWSVRSAAIRLFLICLAAGAGQVGAAPPLASTAQPNSPGTVYFVMCVDTECWYLRPDRLTQPLGTDDFAAGGKIDQIVSPSFRSSYRDSFGGSLRLSWFLATHEAYFHGDPPNPDIVFEAMAPYAAEARTLGDCFGWHYHHSDWCDLDGDGVSYWNELLTFDGSEYCDGADTSLPQPMLAVLLLDQGFYPSCYRAGWLWENTDLSNWLEQIVPFDFSNLSPFWVAQQQPDNLSNIYDWSRAPSDWSAYHPARADYQTPGEMNRWIFRSYPGISGLDSAFARAAAGNDVVVSLYTHSFADISQFHPGKFLYQSAGRFPGVRFKYVNAFEGAHIATGLTDSIAPTADVSRTWNRFTTEVTGSLFAPPLGAVRHPDGSYALVHPVMHRELTNGHHSWTFSLDGETYTAFRIGGTDPAGNTFITDRYAPLDTGSVMGSVLIDGVPYGHASVILSDSIGRILEVGSCDGAGRFCFSGLPNGNYHFSVRPLPGFPGGPAGASVLVDGSLCSVSIAMEGAPELVLPQNYPNPFNNETTISFFLAAASDVRMEVYNAAGQRVATLCDEFHAPGMYSLTWRGDEGSDRLASGVYLLRLRAAGLSQTRKMLLLK